MTRFWDNLETAQENDYSDDRAYGMALLAELSSWVWDKIADGALIDELDEYAQKAKDYIDNLKITDARLTDSGILVIKSLNAHQICDDHGKLVLEMEEYIKAFLKRENLDKIEFKRIMVDPDLAPPSYFLESSMRHYKRYQMGV
jgi:hypothetical protein